MLTKTMVLVWKLQLGGSGRTHLAFLFQEKSAESGRPMVQPVLGTLKVSGTQTEEQKAKVEKPKG